MLRLLVSLKDFGNFQHFLEFGVTILVFYLANTFNATVLKLHDQEAFTQGIYFVWG